MIKIKFFAAKMKISIAAAKSKIGK